MNSLRKCWLLAGVLMISLALTACPPPAPTADDGYYDGGDDGGDDGTSGTAGTCPNATLDEIREWTANPVGSPPGWASHAPPYSIQTTAFCGSACLGAYEYGERSIEVQEYCRLMFAVSPQVQGDWCPVCAPFKP